METVIENSFVDINLTPLVSDAENNALTFTVVSNPASGSITNLNNGQFRYIHNGNEGPSDSFTYQVTDGFGGVATGDIDLMITPVNDAPVATDAMETVIEGSDVLIDLSLLVSDDDNLDSDLTYTLFTGPDTTVGNVVNEGGGMFRYTHEGNEIFDDTFTYQVSDGSRTDTGVVTLMVTPVNDAPIASDDTRMVVEGGFINIDLTMLVSDAENNNLSFTVVTGPSTGSVTNLGGGQFIYTHNNDEVFIDSFTYQVTDGLGGVATGDIDLTINSVNDAPIVNQTLADFTVDEGTSETYDIPAGAITDPDGDVLAYTLSSADGSPLPSWLTIDAATGQLSADPAFTDAGIYPVVLTATDPSGLSVPTMISVIVEDVNRPPSGIQISNVSVDEGVSGLAIAELIVSDLDVNDSHVIAVDDPRFEVLNGELWLTAGNELDFETESQVNLTLEISDSGGNTTSVPFVVNVNNVNEVPVSLESELSEFDSAPFAIDLPDDFFTDEDGDELTITATQADGSPLPEWIVFDPDTLQITVTEDAPLDETGNLIITADDGNGESTSVPLTINIAPPLAAAFATPEDIFTPIEVEVFEPVVEQISTVTEEEPEETESGTITTIASATSEDREALETTTSMDSQDVLNVFDELLDENFEESFDVVTSEQFIQDVFERDDTDAATFVFRGAALNFDNTPLESLFSSNSFETDLGLRNSMRNLDLQRETLREDLISIERVTQTTVTVSTGVSIGYIVWLIRSGAIIGSVLSALPAWRAIDPLPVLGTFEGGDDDNSESLQQMVDKENDNQPEVKQTLSGKVASMFGK